MELFQYAIYLLLFIFLVDYIIKPKHKNVLPHRIPIIGHILIFRGAQVHTVLRHWSQKFGSRYTIQILHKHVVVLSTYEEIYEMLVTKGKALGGRFKNFRCRHFLKDGMAFTDYSDQWHKRSLFVNKHLKPHGEELGEMQEIIMDIVQQFIDEIQIKTSINQVFDPYEDIRLVAMNSIFSVITGTKYNLKDKEFLRWVEIIDLGLSGFSFNNGFLLDFFPFLRFFGNKTYNQCEQFRHLLGMAIDDLRNKYKNNSNTSFGLAKALFDESQNGEIMSNEAIKYTLTDIIFGASNTLSLSLYCLLQILAEEPETQQTLFDEIQSVLTKHNSEIITLENREEMPYAKACLFELMRYVTVSPIAVPHRALLATQIAGEYYERETIFIPNLFHLHHDEKYWENPWEFQPQRFLDSNGDVVSPDHNNRRHLLPFGAGTRVCLGQNLAMARLFIVMTSIVREFVVSTCGNERHDPKSYGFDITILPNMYPIRFISRTA